MTNTIQPKTNAKRKSKLARAVAQFKYELGTVVKVPAYVKRPQDKALKSWKALAVVVGGFGDMAKLVPSEPAFVAACSAEPGSVRAWRKQPFIFREWSELQPA